MSVAGQNLKYLRKLRGWTQEEFAAKLGIKRSLLGAYEEERAVPRLEVLETIGDMFKLTLDELAEKAGQFVEGLLKQVLLALAGVFIPGSPSFVHMRPRSLERYATKRFASSRGLLAWRPSGMNTR